MCVWPDTQWYWHAFPCLPGPPSMRGCSAYAPGLILHRSACLRLILLCTCPPLCAGALWPMPAWVVMPDVSVFVSSRFRVSELRHAELKLILGTRGGMALASAASSSSAPLRGNELMQLCTLA